MTHAMDPLTSALSDRYTIDREIGAGGMATVTTLQNCNLVPMCKPCKRSQYGYVHSRYGKVCG